MQACSFYARALWREMIDLTHDGEPYGHLTAGGVAITPGDLARMVGASPAKVKQWIKELDDRKVFSRTPEGVIYSRRMVRDERKRTVRAAGGLRSLENPNVPRPKDTHKDGRKDGSKDTLRPSLDRSFVPSPAVAVAVASAVATTSTTTLRVREALPEPDRPAFDKLIESVPEPEAWAAECAAILDGMPGHHHLDAAGLGRAIKDFAGNGALTSPNLRKFRRYVEGAKQEKARPQASDRSLAESIFTIFTTQGLTQNLPIDQHDARLEEYARQEKLPPVFVEYLKGALRVVKPWTWMGRIRDEDRGKALVRIEQALAAIPQAAA